MGTEKTLYASPNRRLMITAVLFRPRSAKIVISVEGGEGLMTTF